MGKQFAIARYTEDGDLDGSFGGTGRVLTDFLSTEAELANAVVVDGEDRVVAAGRATDGGQSRFALARYTPAGELDDSFHGDGKVLTDLDTSSEGANAVTIDSQDRLVVAGTGVESGTDTRIAVARYTDDGHLDPSFNWHGSVLTDFFWRSGERGNAVVTDWQDRVYVVGEARDDGRSEIALVRYTEGGWHDGWFDWDGKVLTDIIPSTDESGVSVLAYNPSIDPFYGGMNPGGLFVGATANVGGAGRQFALVGYYDDGALRRRFGDEGTALVNFGSSADETLADLGWYARDGVGGVVAAGSARMRDGSRRIAVARVRYDGTLDETFDRDGKVLTRLPFADDLTVTGVAVDRCGRTVVTGSAEVGSSRHFFVVRYNPDGSRDRTCGDDGTVVTDFPSASNERATDVAIDSLGRVVVVGSADV
jgi:uncharacterized delta-60 repeat protein